MDQDNTLRGEVGEYRVYESIASGGFGSVYYGLDTTDNIPVAVKRLHPHLKHEPGVIERFEGEASTVRGFVHANIVRLIDQGRDSQGLPFLVMEWVQGLTVAGWLKRRGPYLPADAADVACQALEGLHAAWLRRIVHRDIKPANIMVTRDGQVKVMDFGVAKAVDLANAAGTTNITGTPAYMAPEQMQGRPLDCRADIYAMGVTLYQMIVGVTPFQGPSMADFFRQHMQEAPPPLVGVDVGLAVVVERALAKDPDERFSTPGEMQHALRPFASQINLETIVRGITPQPGPYPGVTSGTTPSSYPSVPKPRPTYPAPPLDETDFVRRGATPATAPRRPIPLKLLSVAAAGALLVLAVGGWLIFGRTGSGPTPPSGQPSIPTPSTASGGVLFQDMFDDATRSRFQKQSTDPVNYSVLFGSDGYVVQKVNPSAPALVTVPVPTTPGVTYDDVFLAVDAQLLDPTPNRYIALVCRDQENRAGYRLAASPATGQVTLARLEGGSAAPTTLKSAVTPQLRQGSELNRLELACVGQNLTARVNGLEVGTAQDTRFATGNLRIGAGAEANGPLTAEAHFKSVVVTRP